MKNLIYFCFLSLIFVSCIEKRITRLDRKAVERVEANVILQKRVFVNALPLYPCINDTIVKTKTDTTMVINTVWETHRDTIIKKVTQTIRLTDTIKITVQDKQVVTILNDSINAKNKQLAFKDGQILEKDKQNKDQKKKELYLWFTISGLICSIGIGVYLKLRKII